MKLVKKRVPIYRNWMWVCWLEDGDTLDAVNVQLRRRVNVELPLKADDEIFGGDVNSAGGVLMSYGDIFLLVVRVGCKTGVLAHECFHLVCGVMRNCGVVYSKESEEAYAYLLTWVVDEVEGCRPNR